MSLAGIIIQAKYIMPTILSKKINTNTITRNWFQVSHQSMGLNNSNQLIKNNYKLDGSSTQHIS
jgi:hypothetical protein